MAEKMTKRMVINEMLANEVIKSNTVWVDYLHNELEILDNKNKNRKSASDKEENIILLELVRNAIQEVGSGTATEIQSVNPQLVALSNQKMVYLLKVLIEEKIVVKDKIKGKTIFSYVKGE